jgi:hypothetical protein
VKECLKLLSSFSVLSGRLCSGIYLDVFLKDPTWKVPVYQCSIDFERVSGRLNNLTPACTLFSCAISANSILRISAGDGKVPIMLNLGILTVLN